VQALSLFSYLHHYFNIRGPFFVVAPLSTTPHWQREVERWTTLNAVIYHGSAEARNIIREHEFRKFNGVVRAARRPASLPSAIVFAAALDLTGPLLAGLHGEGRVPLQRADHHVRDGAHRRRAPAQDQLEVPGQSLFHPPVGVCVLTSIPLLRSSTRPTA
jgi:hypothetical protein